jgi:hypothetical protein
MISVTTQFKEEEVEINGQTYVVKEMDGVAREAYVEYLSKSKEEGYKMLPATLISVCLFTKEGAPAFTAEQINKWPAKVIDAVYGIADSLNTISDGSRDKAKNDSGASV